MPFASHSQRKLLLDAGAGEKTAGHPSSRVNAAVKADAAKAAAFMADLPRTVSGYTGPPDVMRKHNVHSYDPASGVVWFKGSPPSGRAWDDPYWKLSAAERSKPTGKTASNNCGHRSVNNAKGECIGCLLEKKREKRAAVDEQALLRSAMIGAMSGGVAGSRRSVDDQTMRGIAQGAAVGAVTALLAHGVTGSDSKVLAATAGGAGGYLASRGPRKDQPRAAPMFGVEINRHEKSAVSGFAKRMAEKVAISDEVVYRAANARRKNLRELQKGNAAAGLGAADFDSERLLAGKLERFRILRDQRGSRRQMHGLSDAKLIMEKADKVKQAPGRNWLQRRTVGQRAAMLGGTIAAGALAAGALAYGSRDRSKEKT